MYVQFVNHVDMERLQHALSALSKWAEKWQLTVSVDKCCVLNIGIENCPHHYVLNNYVLPVVPHTRLECDLSPAIHVAEVVKLIDGPNSFCEPLHLAMLSYLSVLLLLMCYPYWSIIP